jgi:hypothetical protein
MKKLNLEKKISAKEFAEDLLKIGYNINPKTGIIERIERTQKMIIGMVIVSVVDFVKGPEDEYADQLDNFAVELAKPEMQAQYGYDDAFKEEAAADAAYNRYGYTKRTTVAPYVHAWTAKKNEIRKGTGITVTAFKSGVDVVIDAPPTEVLPGNELRFRTKAQWLKDQTTLTTEASEIALGISTAHKSTDTTGIKPDLSYELVSGGHPQLKYTRHSFQGIQLKVDRGDGHGFVWLAEPGNVTYTDNATLPPVGNAFVWKYIAIYKLDDELIGDWCDPISVTVKGV